MQMCETDAGTWLIGTHTVRINEGPEFAHNRRTDRQYLLRSEDQGETWELLPDARPNGWFIEQYDVMLEGRPINLGGGRALFCTRAGRHVACRVAVRVDGRAAASQAVGAGSRCRTGV